MKQENSRPLEAIIEYRQRDLPGGGKQDGHHASYEPRPAMQISAAELPGMLKNYLVGIVERVENEVVQDRNDPLYQASEQVARGLGREGAAGSALKLGIYCALRGIAGALGPERKA